MVLDSRSRNSTTENWPSWPITGTHSDIITSNDGLTQTAYVDVDFSDSFSNAVSCTSGRWNGNTFVATLSLFGK